MGCIKVFNSVVSRKRVTKLISLVAVVVLCLVICETQSESQVAASANFGLFLDRVQRVYFAPNGVTLDGMRRYKPMPMAIVFGHALRQQIPYVNRNQNLNPLFISLQNQIRNYLAESVRIYGNSPIYRGQDGQRTTFELLWQGVVEAMQGQWDNIILRDYHVPQGSMPLALAPGSPSSINGPQNLPLKKTKPQPEMDMLGVKPEKGLEEKDRYHGPMGRDTKPSAPVKPDSVGNK